MLSILIKKELLLEFRARESLTSMAAFGLVVILTFSFAFNFGTDRFGEMVPGLFWIMILFGAVLGLNRSFAYEKEFDAFSMLISAPVDRGLIFLAKWITGFLTLTLMEMIILVPFIIFLRVGLPADFVIGIGIILLGNAAIMCMGNFVSGLAMRARLSEVLLPILLLPLVTPVIIASVQSTVGWMRGMPINQWNSWLFVLGSFIIIFGLLGYTLFDHITEE